MAKVSLGYIARAYPKKKKKPATQLGNVQWWATLCAWEFASKELQAPP